MHAAMEGSSPTPSPLPPRTLTPRHAALCVLTGSPRHLGLPGISQDLISLPWLLVGAFLTLGSPLWQAIMVEISRICAIPVGASPGPRGSLLSDCSHLPYSQYNLLEFSLDT
jgi:hypothetical protein